MDINEIILEHIIAFIPVYLSLKGNCTLIYTKEGKSYDIDKTLNTVLNQLARYYLVDLKATRRYCANILSIKNLTPIPFNMDNIFAPIKVRKPLFKNDGSIGYVNIEYIDEIRKHRDITLIHLTNDITIECLSSLQTVNRHIKNGYIVKKFWKERQSSLQINERDFYEEYNQPATKGDIALLIKEILEIKEVIR